MKKTASIIISFIMLISLFLTPIASYAEASYESGDYRISMSGWSGDCIITGYTGNDSDVIIPSEFTKTNDGGIIKATPTKIDIDAFAECDFIVSVTVPDTITSISYYAFEKCTALEKIVIPPSVQIIKSDKYIGDTFADCNNLTIYGYTNSVAEKYAKESNIPFKSIGIYTEPTTPSTTKTPVSTVKTTTQVKTTAPPAKTTPTITTKKAIVKKLSSKKKRQLKVTWKKVSGAQGYEIKLATNKAFTKNKKTVKVKKGSATSKTIKKLKSGKKYYVKIRAYKKVTIDGYTVTANGPWSQIKSKKVK